MASLEELLATVSDEQDQAPAGTEQPTTEAQQETPREKAAAKAQTPSEDLAAPAELKPEPPAPQPAQIKADADGVVQELDGLSPETALDKSAGISPILRTLLASQELSTEDQRASVQELLTKDIRLKDPIFGAELPEIEGVTFFEGLAPDDVAYTPENGITIRGSDGLWTRFDVNNMPSAERKRKKEQGEGARLKANTPEEFLADTGEVLPDLVPDVIGGIAGAAVSAVGTPAAGIATGAAVTTGVRAVFKSVMGKMMDASEKPSEQWAKEIGIDILANLGSDAIILGAGAIKAKAAKAASKKLSAGVPAEQVEKEANAQLSRDMLSLQKAQNNTPALVRSINNAAQNADQASKNIIQDSYRQLTQGNRFQSQIMDTDLQLNGYNDLSRRFGLFGDEGGLQTSDKLSSLNKIQVNSLRTASTKQDGLVEGQYLANRGELLTDPGIENFRYNPKIEIANAINTTQLADGSVVPGSALNNLGLVEKEGVWEFAEDSVNESFVDKTIMNLPQNRPIVQKFVRNINQLSRIPELKGQKGLEKALDLKKSMDDFIGIVNRSQKDPQVKAALEGTLARTRGSIASSIEKTGGKSAIQKFERMNSHYAEWADFRGMVRKAKNAATDSKEISELVNFYNRAASDDAKNLIESDWYTSMRNSPDEVVRKTLMRAQAADMVAHQIDSLEDVTLRRRAGAFVSSRSRAAATRVTGAAAKEIRDAGYTLLQFSRQIDPDAKKALLRNDAALRSIMVEAGRSGESSVEELEGFLQQQGVIPGQR